MSKKFKWGVLGPGRISHKFAEGLKSLHEAELYAVGSRSVERASAFASEYGAEKSYGSYQELAADPEVDIIYIATPHPFHYEWSLMCLEAGKAVLCEKPVTINKNQLEHLVQIAREKKVFLMEALWTRFLPHIRKIEEIRDEQTLGRIRFVNADFGFRGEYNPENRLFNPDLGGGALLDIGIYPVFLALLLMGKPDEIIATAQFAQTGVDESTSMIFSYQNKNLANLSCTFMADTPVRADIIFEKGRIRIDGRWFTPTLMTVIDEHQNVEEFSFREVSNGYQHQAEECMNCLREGITESPLLDLDFSLIIMETLDRIRSITGLKYAADE